VVDFNLVATEDGESKAGVPRAMTISESQLTQLIALGRKGVAELIAAPTRGFGAHHDFARGKLNLADDDAVVTRLWRL